MDTGTRDHKLARYAEMDLLDSAASLHTGIAPKKAVTQFIRAGLEYCDIVLGRSYEMPDELLNMFVEDPDELRILFDLLGVSSLEEAIEQTRQLLKE